MAWHGQASAVGGKGDTVSYVVPEEGLVCNQGLCTIMNLYLYSVTEQRNLSFYNVTKRFGSWTTSKLAAEKLNRKNIIESKAQFHSV